MKQLDASAAVRLRPGYRLQWEPTQEAHVLLYPEGVVSLNDSAAAVLELCDGTRSGREIVAVLSERFPDADLAADVIEFLEVAQSEGWIHTR